MSETPLSLWDDLPPEMPRPTSPRRTTTKAGTLCQACVHLRRMVEMSHPVYKCDLHPHLTHGAATDHRVRWPACARYEVRS